MMRVNRIVSPEALAKARRYVLAYSESEIVEHVARLEAENTHLRAAAEYALEKLTDAYVNDVDVKGMILKARVALTEALELLRADNT